jgi:hypothetical protein
LGRWAMQQLLHVAVVYLCSMVLLQGQ